MLCEKCNKNEATVHYTEIMSGKKSEHHLCNECASEVDLNYYSDILDNEFPLAKLLTGLLAAGKMIGRESSSPMSHVICPKCGMNYEEFTKVGKFGCEECYNVFAPLIEEHIKKLHGNVNHKGKRYKQNDSEINILKDKNEEIEIMQAKLKEAITLENYEEAAQIRDEIKALKERMGEDA